MNNKSQTVYLFRKLINNFLYITVSENNIALTKQVLVVSIVFRMIQPDYASAMGLLAHLNSDELKEMLNDDTKFDSVLKDFKQVNELKYKKNKNICLFN